MESMYRNTNMLGSFGENVIISGIQLLLSFILPFLMANSSFP